MTWYESRYAGPIVGRIFRSKSCVNGTIAKKRAQTMPWWDDSLLLDKRDKKFWVWRAKI